MSASTLRRGQCGAEGGATWGETDRETQLFGLAVPGGVVSTTGIAGLTLHGGVGHLRRKHGLSIDNLIAVDIVIADGQLRTASVTENEDLFWAVRGAGSNFGVVTSFEFRAHPVGPMVMVGAVFYPLDDVKELLPAWRDYMASAPDQLSSIAFCWSVPTAEPFPPEHHEKPVLVVALSRHGEHKPGTFGRSSRGSVARSRTSPPTRWRRGSATWRSARDERAAP